MLCALVAGSVYLRILLRISGCFLADDEAVVEVNIPGSESSEAFVRKRTAGILDMGGVSTQIAYEVPKTVSFASSQQVIICTNSFRLVYFSFNMFPSILFCFLSLNTSLLSLLRYHLLNPGERRQEETKANSTKPFVCSLKSAGLFP